MCAAQHDIETVRDLFTHKLRELYYIEHQLVDELHDHAGDADQDDIEDAFADHRDETKEHIDRLEDVFNAIGEPAEEGRSAVLDAMIEEHEQFHDRATGDDIHDIYLLMVGMQTERMEMTAYEGLIMLARKAEMGRNVTKPLNANLDDEEAAFRELQSLATGSTLKTLWNRLLG